MLTCFKLVNAAIVCFLLLLTSAAASHVSASYSAVSIIDILSNSDQFSVLLQHLQRTGLVPLLNEVKNVTFIAPINEAFDDVPDESVTRNRLLFHLLNQTIFMSRMDADLIAPTYLTSANLAAEMNKPGLEKSENYPLPVYLSYHGSSDKPSLTVGGSAVIEADLNVTHGHSAVQVVDQLMSIPPSVCEFLDSNPKTSFFSKLFKMEFNCSLPMLPSYATILVPTDDAFEIFNEVEKSYLLSEWGEEDRIVILTRHIIDCLIASPMIQPEGVNATAMDGTTIFLSKRLSVNDSLHPLEKNILASDAVVHMYDSIISQTPLINFTPKKYCLGLGASDFVEEIRFRKLMHLLNGDTEPQTLFAPVPVADMSTQDLQVTSTSTVLYHFVKGQHKLDFDTVLTSNVLLESKSVHKKLGNGNQRIKVIAEQKTHMVYLNGRDPIESKPYTVGNTTIFAIQGTLSVPPTLDLAVGSVFQSSQSATYLNNLGLLDLPTKEGWTVLLPTTRAWDKLGLVKTYLESNSTALLGVLQSHIFSHPFYSNSDPIDTKLLDGSNASVRILNPTGAMRDNSYHLAGTRFSIMVDDTQFNVETPNVLSSSGVVHSVSDVHIPVHIDVNPIDILDSVDASIFVDLLIARNMSYVLDPDSSYTILTPSDQVLKAANITVDTKDIDVLLRLHVIPNNPIDKFLDQGESVETLESGVHLTAKELNSGLYLVSIVEGDKREIRVLNRGNSSVRDAKNVTTILYVDRFLNPEWIESGLIPPFKPPFHLKTPVAILLGVVFGAMLIFGVLSCGLFVFLGRARALKSPSASRSPSDLDRRPLLRNSAYSSRRSSFREPRGLEGDQAAEDDGYGATSVAPASRRSSMQSLRSEHSVSEPISTIKIQKDREHGRHLGLPRV